MSGVKKIPVQGDSVRVYKVSKRRFFGTVKQVYDTPVEHVKLYEIVDSSGTLHYATLDALVRLPPP